MAETFIKTGSSITSNKTVLDFTIQLLSNWEESALNHLLPHPARGKWKRCLEHC